MSLEFFMLPPLRYELFHVPNVWCCPHPFCDYFVPFMSVRYRGPEYGSRIKRFFRQMLGIERVIQALVEDAFSSAVRHAILRSKWIAIEAPQYEDVK